MTKKIGILINSGKQQAIDIGREIYLWSKEHGVSIHFPIRDASVLNVEGVTDNEWLHNTSSAIVVGGDGTFLHAARYVLDYDIPLYGINTGNLGFLTYGRPENVFNDIKCIIEGEYTIFERPILIGNVVREGEIVHSFHALNEFVLTEEVSARLLKVDVFFNQQKLGQLSADGIIVASPTGSTAYSMSAGGPIVPPYIACMVFVPICAHTLYARPIIAGASDEISLIPRIHSRNIVLTYDGQLACEILPNDMITVKLSTSKTIKSIQMYNRSFLDLIHEKLGWGQSFMGEEKE
ncbi:MAG: NAD(+)/NADH kinase [Synergistaceae bacterium]|nr:NAD(+)/NADH kinase [Synergistaceae bacterium]MCL2147035.1 NAD(+)/NADH kinase [Synergistaceae bacterium]